jgi:uncharacterized repeat protein (TIGR01451 family)
MSGRVHTGVVFASLLLLGTCLLAASVHAATIRGTLRSETLRGTPAADRVLGLRGNDKLYGFAGADFVSGGAGRDLIDGGKGDDNLIGGSESDLIRGGSGNDSIFSRDGVRDLVNCGPGRDVVGVDVRDRVTACEDVRLPLLPPTVTDLAVALSAPPDPVALNTDLTYMATVTNAGSDPAVTVGLSFALPSGVTYVGASTATGSCQFLAPTVSCSLGAIAPGTARTASLVIRILAGTTVVVSASASSQTQDSNSTNNSASVTSTVNAPPPPPTSCDPSYPTVCIPPPPPDLDCSDIPYRNFTVLPPDPHGFDGNRDGIGCES